MSLDVFHKELVALRRVSVIDALKPLIEMIPPELDEVRGNAYDMMHDLYHVETVIDVNFLADEIEAYVVENLEKVSRGDEGNDDGGIAVPVKK